MHFRLFFEVLTTALCRFLPLIFHARNSQGRDKTRDNFRSRNGGEEKKGIAREENWKFLAESEEKKSEKSIYPRETTFGLTVAVK